MRILASFYMLSYNAEPPNPTEWTLFQFHCIFQPNDLVSRIQPSLFLYWWKELGMYWPIMQASFWE